MDPETHREFLRQLTTERLHAHMKEYVRSGMDAEAARCDMEIERRRKQHRTP